MAQKVPFACLWEAAAMFRLVSVRSAHLQKENTFICYQLFCYQLFVPSLSRSNARFSIVLRMAQKGVFHTPKRVGSHRARSSGVVIAPPGHTYSGAHALLIIE